MSNYRREWVPGGTYFFTVTLANRRSRLLVDAIPLLRKVYVEARKRMP
jgi:putative transposase